MLSNTDGVSDAEHGRQGTGIIGMRLGVCSKRWAGEQGVNLLTLGLGRMRHEGAMVVSAKPNHRRNVRCPVPYMPGTERQRASSGSRTREEDQRKLSVLPAEGE